MCVCVCVDLCVCVCMCACVCVCGGGCDSRAILAVMYCSEKYCMQYFLS